MDNNSVKPSLRIIIICAHFDSNLPDFLCKIKCYAQIKTTVHMSWESQNDIIKTYYIILCSLENSFLYEFKSLNNTYLQW